MKFSKASELLDYPIVWPAVAAAAVLSINLLWSVIERPLIELVALGHIPGTGVSLTYEQILLASLTIFSTWLTAEHINHKLKRPFFKKPFKA